MKRITCTVTLEVPDEVKTSPESAALFMVKAIRHQLKRRSVNPSDCEISATPAKITPLPLVDAETGKVSR